MTWREKLSREFVFADRQFVEKVLPVGAVDRAAFGLIADATRYLLVEEGGEVHLRAEIAAPAEVLGSLARSGLGVPLRDAEVAVARFAALWEETARRRGTWDAAVAEARRAGEVHPPHRPTPRPSLLTWLRRRMGRA